MILFNKNYLKIEYNNKHKYYYVQWKDFCTSEEFRYGILDNLYLLKIYKANKILIDTMQHDLILKDDTDWLVEYITPILINHGMKVQAFVLPEDVFARVSVHNYKEALDNRLFTRYFDNKEEALQWLINFKIKN